jgi:hypothetical protein
LISRTHRSQAYKCRNQLGHLLASRRKAVGTFLWASSLCAAALLVGCSASKTPVQVGNIKFTDANGKVSGNKLTAVSAGAAIYVDVQLADDKQLLGVDWTVTCGSAPPPGSPLPPGVTQDDSCGIFLPVHTASAPVPSYASSGAGVVTLFTVPASPPKQGVVTLYAAATADHSRYSSVTLTVVGLPISIQFGSVPVSSLPVNGTVAFKAVLTNDYVSGGVNWSAACGASSCGTFSPAKTASGVATTYTAPATVPPGGTVVISATSVTDPTKSISSTVTIEPVSVSVSAASSSVETGSTDLVSATVMNDVTNAGVDWTLNCDTAGACGTIDAHTASGTAATYTAPGTIPASGQVTIRATSTADKSATASQAVTVAPSTSITGTVMSGHDPVVSASVSLYAAGLKGYGSESTLFNSDADPPPLTDEHGSFKIPGPLNCPSPSSRLYLIARGGNAGGGQNPNLALMSWIGRCDDFARSHNIVVNEVTTIVSSYALAQFMRNEAYLGSPAENTGGLDQAGSLIHDLANPPTGEAREHTVRGNGRVPFRQINVLANTLHLCAASGGGSASDGSPCGRLFAIAGGNSTDTLQAALFIAHHGADSSLAPIDGLSTDADPFQPIPDTPPADWTLRLIFRPDAIASSRQTLAQPPWVDAAGNTWIFDPVANALTELIGASRPNPALGMQDTQP